MGSLEDHKGFKALYTQFWGASLVEWMVTRVTNSGGGLISSVN